MGRQSERRTNRQIQGVDGWTDGQRDKWIDGGMYDGWMDGWTDGQRDKWIDGGMYDGWMDGQRVRKTNRQMQGVDRWTDEYRHKGVDGRIG